MIKQVIALATLFIVGLCVQASAEELKVADARDASGLFLSLGT